MSWTCPGCGAAGAAGSRFCTACGASAAFCRACRAPLSPALRFCNACGAPVAERRSPLLFCLAVAAAAAVLVGVGLWFAFSGEEPPHVEPTPPKPRDSVREPTALGDVLAEARIGPDGGRLDVPGRISVEFPQGALSSDQPVSIHEASHSPGDGVYFYVECPAQSGLLRRPARLTISIPDGMPAERMAMIEEVLPGLWTTVPSSDYDPATRTMTGEVLHFSGKAVAICSTGGGLLTGAGWYGLSALGVVAAPGAIGLGGCAVLAAGAAVGAGLSDAVEDAWLKLNAGRALRFAGTGADPEIFEVLWDENDFGREGLTVCLDGSGRVQTMIPGFHTRGDAVDYLQNLQKKPWDSIASVQFVPEGIARLLALLDWVQYYMHGGYTAYPKPGYPAAGTLTVLVQPCGANAAGEPNDGQWNGKFLYVSPSHVTGLIADGRGRLSEQGLKSMRTLAPTLAHEYFHSIHSTINPRAQSVGGDTRDNYIPWLDETMARAYESEVFPTCTGTFSSLQWSTVMGRLGGGLGKVGSGDEAGELWPLGKYMLHTEKYGPRFVLEAAFAGADRSRFLPLFEEFAFSLFVRERALPPTAENSGTDGGTMSVPTGWAILSEGLKCTAPEGLKVGRTNMQMEAVALRFRRVTIEKCDVERRLVIRRDLVPAPETLLALKPTGVADVGVPRPGADCLRNSAGGLLIPPDWLKGKADKFVLPVAFLTGNKGVEHANAVLVYALAPPATVSFSDVDQDTVEIRWTSPPEPGGDLKRRDVYLGYSLFGRDGEEHHIADLIFGDEETEISKGAVFVKQILPDTVSIRVPRFIVEKYPQLGLATMDLVLKEDERTGRPALSPIVWSTPSVQLPMIQGFTLFKFPYLYRITGSVVYSADDRSDAFDSRGFENRCPLSWSGTFTKISEDCGESHQVSSITLDAKATKIERFEVHRWMGKPSTTFTFKNIPLVHREEVGKTGHSIYMFAISGGRETLQEHLVGIDSKITNVITETVPGTDDTVESTVTITIERLDEGLGGLLVMMTELTDERAEELHRAGKLSEEEMEAALKRIGEAMMKFQPRQ